MLICDIGVSTNMWKMDCMISIVTTAMSTITPRWSIYKYPQIAWYSSTLWSKLPQIVPIWYTVTYLIFICFRLCMLYIFRKSLRRLSCTSISIIIIYKHVYMCRACFVHDRVAIMILNIQVCTSVSLITYQLKQFNIVFIL